MKRDKPEEIRKEYKREDLGTGVRGKYLDAYQSGTNLVLLNPDVAKVFPTEDAVNEALRALIEISGRSISPTKRSSRGGKNRVDEL